MTQPAPGAITLFLDFDGVTHPYSAIKAPERMFEAAPLIEAVLREHPEVEVVLSTSWRESYPLDELRYLFSIDIAERVIGITPIYSGDRQFPMLPFERSTHTRHAECQIWLHENRSLDHPWIVIDDMAKWFDEDLPNLLQTNPVTGFVPADQERLRAMIRECHKLRALAVAIKMTGDKDRASFLMQNEPLKAFDNKTADTLIKEGRSVAVIAYLQSLAGGAAG